LLAFAPASLSAAARDVVLGTETRQLSLAGHVEHFEDRDGTLGIAEVANDENPPAFRRVEQFWSHGFSRSAHWYRFTVYRIADAPAQWVLDIGAPYLNDIQIYLPDDTLADKDYRMVQMGDHVPPSGRPMRTRQHALPLAFPPEKPVTIYFRVATNSVVSVTASLNRPDIFTADETRDSLLWGLYFGVMLLVILVYGALGIWLGNSALIAYVLHVLALFGNFFAIEGYMGLVFVNLPGWAADAFSGTIAFAVSSSAIYLWLRLLDLRRNFPRIEKLYVFLFLVSLAGLPTVTTHAYGPIAQIAWLMGVSIAYVSLALVVVLIWRKGPNPDLLSFFLAFLATTVGSTARVSMALGFLPSTMLTENAFQIGAIAHVLFLNFGLAYRMRQIEKGKIRAEQEASTLARRAEEQSHFVAMLSHEFRSPLASIDRAAQMIEVKTPELPERTRERLERIRAQASQLDNLVSMFLTSQSLESGYLAADRRQTKVGGLVGAVIEKLDPETRSRIAVNLVDPDREIPVDPPMMEIALGNLISNALKYSPADNPIVVTCSGGRETFLITVADRGPGMSAADVAKLGTKYFRASTSAGIKGTGLGLHIVRKVAEAHGGELIVHSRPGEGTRMTLRLPTSGESVRP
jgi:signal transduction histidine kinase